MNKEVAEGRLANRGEPLSVLEGYASAFILEPSFQAFMRGAGKETSTLTMTSRPNSEL